MDIKVSRRQFIKGAAILGAGMALPLKFGVKSAHAFYYSPGLSKWATTLRSVGPGQIPVAIPDGTAAPKTGVTHYKVAIQEFLDELHPLFGPNTKLWGYNPYNALGVSGIPTPKHLGGIFVVQKGTPIQITFRNNLPSRPIIPIDTTLPGANQAANRAAVHLHGGLVPWISDGGPFDWWAPDGTHGLSFLNNQVLNPWAAANEAEYYYGNNQSARFVWYHEHAHGITRLNAYAGVASGFIIRDQFEANMRNLGLPDFIENGGFELPIVVQDKTFVGSDIATGDPTWVQKGLPSTPGSLWYPHIYEKNRFRMIGAGRRLPNPSVLPEVFGDTMLANGTVYPQVTLEARPYRFRMLNACNARFLNLQLLEADTLTPDGITYVDNLVPNNPAGPDWLVLGTEGGFLWQPVVVPSKGTFNPDTLLGSLVTGNAERWDVIVDFTNSAGKSYILYNDAPGPFPGGDPRYDFYIANPTNPVGPSQPGFGPDTRSIMKFNVVPASGPVTPVNINAGNWNPGIDPFLIPMQYVVDGTWQSHIPPGTNVRRMTINETFDAYGRLTQMLGTDTVNPTTGRFGRTYLDPVTETIPVGATEIWEIGNLSADTHPVHFHLVNVQILDRYRFDAVNYTGGAFTPIPGTVRPPEPYERGWKDTVQMHPGEVIRVIMKFDVPPIIKAGGGILATPPSPRTGGNEYVWHCHILEHEEHDMMRPIVVL